MGTDSFILSGAYVQLQPLDREHIDGLVTAASEDPSLYQWSPVPQSIAEATRYVDTALSWQSEGTAVPFAIVRASDGIVIGSTRFWNLERWYWPGVHPEHGRRAFDACEIGYSWLARSALRTAANTESKFLMLRHAFEAWEVLRVCLHTDVRNQRSRTAIERIGGKFEGILRAHRLAADLTPRDSARFSILASEWPSAKECRWRRKRVPVWRAEGSQVCGYALAIIAGPAAPLQRLFSGSQFVAGPGTASGKRTIDLLMLDGGLERHIGRDQAWHLPLIVASV